MAVKPIPDGYHAVTPYLMAKDAAGLLEFLKKAFNARESEKMAAPDGTIMHAEVKIGDSTVMLSEARPPWEPMPAAIYLYVNDVDATHARVVASGGTSVMEPVNQFFGDRHGCVKDRFGNVWFISTHVEDVSPEELRQRAEASMAKSTAS